MPKGDRHDEALTAIRDAPFTGLLGIEIEAAEDGFARLRLPFDLRLLNDGGPDTPVHGGAIVSLVDTAACAAV